nr:lysozyme inhibitor LprI family protein [Stakelama flava]
MKKAIPSKWAQVALARGDLNDDGRADAALLLRDTDPALKLVRGGGAFDTNPYLLAVYFADPGGGYRRVLENHRLIPRHRSRAVDDVTNGGIAIANGNLQISLGLFSGSNSGMGNRSFTFRWRKGANLHSGRFLLTGFDSMEVNRADGGVLSDSYDYLTGRKKHGVGSIEKDATRFAWSDLPRHRLIGLNEVGDGGDFDPEAPPPFPTDAWNWADADTGKDGSKPAYQQTQALCDWLRDLRPPASETPGIFGAPPPAGECESTALYYGIGMPPDPEAARSCAFYEIGNSNLGDDPFAGFGMLMMIYANGKGASRNLDLATAMACRVPAGSSHEVVRRLQHLQALKAALESNNPVAVAQNTGSENLVSPPLVQANPSKPFDFCDDAISNFGNLQCASLNGQIEDARRHATLDALSADWPKARKLAFHSLRDAMNSFAGASGQKEVDLTGSGRSLFIIQRTEEVEKSFIAMLDAYRAGTFQPTKPAAVKQADAALNRLYRRIMAARIAADKIGPWQNADSLPMVSITHSGVREAQRAWLRYRDSWQAFANNYDPHHQKDALLTALIRQRIAVLKGILVSEH